MARRTAVVVRHTAETRIDLQLTIEGKGRYKVSTGIRFFDHMLELFTRHGGFDLNLKCDGDLDVDQHHTVEDVGIALGEAFDRALGDKRGILRAGYFLMPMDETLAIAAVDMSGRAAFVVDTKVRPGWSATCKRSWSRIFWGFARGARPMYMSRPCTAARIITRSRRSSKPSLEHCAWPARATSNWPSMLPSQKDAL